MIEVIIPSDWYGPRTENIKSILRQILDIPWFMRGPSGSEQATVSRLIQTHLEMLRQSASEEVPGRAVVHWLQGDWELLHQNRWGVDPYKPWGDQWKSATEALGLIVQRTKTEIISRPTVRSLFRPPLWPMEGNCNVCGEALVARQEVIATQLNIPPGGRDWNVVWGLLCQAEDRVWNALLWEVAAGAGIVQDINPFKSLLDAYALGAFPMGWAGDDYDVYAHESLKTTG